MNNEEYPWNYEYIKELFDEIGCDEEQVLKRIMEDHNNFEEFDDVSFITEITKEQIRFSIQIYMNTNK